ncbi:MAG TPA: phage protein Gp37 [Planctomycetota bacterium]|nr:phage protein Gp37 [Planctomycetota bacterium]
MTTAYDTIEDGIVTQLTAEDSPFATVLAYGAQLSDAELADELEKLLTKAPAALVVFEGGRTNEGYGGALMEEAIFAVLVVAGGRSRTASLRGDKAAVGVYTLIDYCRAQLHNVPGISGIVLPLLWQGSRRLALPGNRLTVAAYVCTFKARIERSDGPLAA